MPTNGTVSAELRALVEQFERDITPTDAFPHAEHMKVAFAYLCVYPKLEALERFSNGIKRRAIAKNKPKAYHETITWAHLFLIHERMQRTGTREWEQFAAANQDLFDWKNSILNRYYSKALLESDLARETFVMPDQLPLT